MGISSNIMRRKGSSCYYLRIFVPKELQATFGKQEITKSLRTPNPREAKRLARPLQMEWDQKFSSMVQQAKRPLDEYQLQHAIWDRYNALLKADEARRASRPTKEDLDAIWAAVVQEFDGPDIATWRILEGIAGEPGMEAQERSKRLAALVADIKSNSIKTIYPNRRITRGGMHRYFAHRHKQIRMAFATKINFTRGRKRALAYDSR